MRRFVNDDAGYIAWLDAHPDGFVLNTYAHVTSTYLIVHRAACRTINRPLAPGKSWTYPYGKTCSDDRQEIEAWALRETGKPVKPCAHCLRGESGVSPVPRRASPLTGAPGSRAPRPIDSAVEFDVSRDSGTSSWADSRSPSPWTRDLHSNGQLISGGQLSGTTPFPAVASASR